MTTHTGEQRTEVVRGRLDPELGERLVGFWTAHGALTEPVARERLEQVVCVRLAGDEIVGVNTAYADEAPLVGRKFWIYRRFLAPGADRSADGEMIAAAHEALAREFTGAVDEPVGICVLVPDRRLIAANPSAVWPGVGLIFAGYTPEGAQVRIVYFDDARITAERPETQHATLGPGYRFLPFSEADEVDEEAVVAFWERQTPLDPSVARQRVGEVAFVAIQEGEGLVGVCTVYLRKSPQLQMDLWHYRTFVSPEHRQSTVARHLIVLTRDYLRERFASGVDTRAPGMAVEVENAIMKRVRNHGVWPSSGLTFIGENERGDHCRVLYFPGAVAPPPPT